MVKLKGIMKKPETMPVLMDQEYPYGLMICLCPEVLDALGYEELPEVGEKLKLTAIVEVCKTEESESKMYGEKKYMDLQITEMQLGKSKTSEKEDVDPEKIYGAPNKMIGTPKF